MGTHTSGQNQDYLQIATVSIPKRDNSAGADSLDRTKYDDGHAELGGHTIPPAPRIQIIQKINHDGEVNRARYMPQNPDLLATKTVLGEIHIFDRTKHPSEPERGGLSRPDIKLIGQNKEGCVLLSDQGVLFFTLSSGMASHGILQSRDTSWVLLKT